MNRKVKISNTGGSGWIYVGLTRMREPGAEVTSMRTLTFEEGRLCE